MKYIYNKYFIIGNEKLFYMYLAVIALIIITTIILVIKEVKKNDNK